MIVRTLGVSHRRALLDADLAPLADAVRGRIVEIGVRRAGRGRFVPESAAARWVRIDIEPRHRPDVVGDAMRLPLRDGVADWVICLEVLQYVETPEATGFAIENSNPVPRSGGCGCGRHSERA